LGSSRGVSSSERRFGRRESVGALAEKQVSFWVIVESKGCHAIMKTCYCGCEVDLLSAIQAPSLNGGAPNAKVATEVLVLRTLFVYDT